MTNIKEMLDGEKNANILSVLETAGTAENAENTATTTKQWKP